MWKRHPGAHFIVGIVLALFLGLGLVLAIPLGSEFWADSQATPLTTEGRVTRVYTPRLRSSLGAFDLQTEANQVYRFEISPRLLDAISYGASLKVNHSLNMLHVYFIEFSSNNSKLYQDRFDPNRLYQQWQSPIVWLVGGMILGCLGALAYSLLALSDWLRTAHRVRGAVIARIEQADNSAAGFALVLRTAGRPKARQQRETSRFRVSQPDFLLTDQADYIELEYSPVFRYVRRLRVLRVEDFPPGEAPALQEGGVNRLRYRPGWYLRMLLFTDFIFATFLFGFAAIVFVTRLSQWFDSGLESQLYERYILPGLALGAFVISLFLMSSFLRKLGDLRAPKKLTIGPVLSKWRVTGVTNDMRRQIVVADGGLQAGGEGVRKFDINSFLYDEIMVGDIVEIEHSPRLRYIFRLEVTGHQELSKNF